MTDDSSVQFIEKSLDQYLKDVAISKSFDLKKITQVYYNYNKIDLFFFFLSFQILIHLFVLV
jgi:hypothetical protein